MTELKVSLFLSCMLTIISFLFSFFFYILSTILKFLSLSGAFILEFLPGSVTVFNPGLLYFLLPL